MRYLLCLGIIFLVASCALAESRLVVLSPSAKDYAVGRAGEYSLGQQFRRGYQLLAHLLNGRRQFRREIATGVVLQYTWRAAGRADMLGWIKMKACGSSGTVRAEASR